MSTDSQIPDHVKHAAANALKVKVCTEIIGSRAKHDVQFANVTLDHDRLVRITS